MPRGPTATAAALSASFTSVPYVEFGVAAMPNLAAYGVAIPTFVLIASTLRHRDRIPVAVLALVGIFSVHLTGGFVVILFLLGWWLLDALRHPVRGRLADALTLAVVAVPTGLILAPQFLGVLKQADIIAGHAFPSFKSVKQGVIDALLLHTRHLNDFPIQFGLVLLCGIGMAIFLYQKIWWPAVLWLVLTVATIYSGAPFHNLAGAVIEEFSKFFYNDPRRLTAVVTMLLTPMAGVALFAVVTAAIAGVKRLADRVRPLPAPAWIAATAVVLAVATVFSGRHYLHRHLVLFGDKYDSVIIDQKDLDAMAYLATLPGAQEHPHRRLQRRRHSMDVRGGRPASAVDPLRLPAADGPRLFPLHLLGAGQHRQSMGGRSGASAQHPLHPHQRADGSRIQGA